MDNNLNRREFLGAAGAIGLLGASKSLFPSWMPRMAFRDPEKMYASAVDGPKDVLVCIFLRGGMDGLSAVAPYSEGANYYDARPTLAVPEPAKSASIDLDGQFALHPALASLHDIYTEGDLAIVHATGSTDESRSHFDAMHFMEAGTPGEKYVGTGWIGRHLQTAAWENDSPFRAIGMGAMIQESMRGPITPLSIRSIADFHFKGREDELVRLQQSLSALYTIDAPVNALDQQASLVFDTIKTLEGLNAPDYRPSAGATYPGEEFGMGLRQVAQLIKADVGLEVACVDLGGWDTHEAQGTLDGEFNQLLGTLGQGLSALYTDLGDRMGNVSVVVMSEFGRRVGENGSQGTDHGHGNVIFLMGGGMNGGKVHTDWPTLAPAALDDGDLAITIDYRNVLAEVVSKRLGNPALDQIFPKHVASPVGVVV